MTPDRSSDHLQLLLSGATLIGTGLAALDVWIFSGPWGVAGLVLAYLAGGIPAGWRAISALWRERVLDIDLLMVTAAVAAAIVGAALEGAVLLTLFSLSTTMESRAMGRARRAVEALMALRPDTALRVGPGGEVVEVPASALLPGDTALLRPGARVPVDGVILEGEGSLDEATITGESVPVRKSAGDHVFEATVNIDGVLTFRVARSMADSTVARMIALVTEAQASRAPSERFSEWFGQRYTLMVLLGTLTAFGVFLWMGQPLHGALYRAATLLVAASPCAIVISVPAAILSALAAAARGGVLFKGGAALETLAEVTAFAFDKTGTLTTGRTEVTRLIPLIPEEELIALAAGVEAHSEHHVAAAIRRMAVERGITPVPVRDAHTLPSEGMVGWTDEGRVWAGNTRLAARMGAAVDHPGLAVLSGAAETVIWVGREARVLGAIGAADRLRASSRSALEALREAGVKTMVMMTGDRHSVGLRIGAQLGLSPEAVHAELLPEDKVYLVSELAGTQRVAFVGDGVNDAAALARADVGVAMGAAGSEIAIQAADVALLSEDMGRLAAAYRLSRHTQKVIRQNLAFAIIMMALLVAGSLFFSLPLPLAVLGHEGGTLLVVLNGLRLLTDPIRR